MSNASPETPSATPRRLLHKTMLGLGLFSLLILSYLGFLTLQFYQQIQQGQLPSEIQARFTKSTLPPPAQLDQTRAYRSTGDPTLGNPRAPLQIVEFADFECPFSREESFVVRELLARFPDKVSFTYRDFPLEDLHPRARPAAEAANCAHEQGKFWAMHDKLFQNAGRLTTADLERYALEIGIAPEQFNACLKNGKYLTEIAEDRADGLAAGVTGTPTFFINGTKIAGAIPKELWEQILARVR